MIVPAFVTPWVVEPSEYIPVELLPIVIVPVFVRILSATPYRPVDVSPIVIVPVALLLRTPNLAYIPVEFAPLRLIEPSLFNVTAFLLVVKFSCAIAVCPAWVPVIVLLLLLSIDEFEISNWLYASFALSKSIDWFNANLLKYSINVL